jgi:hypothetical protein
MSQPVESISSRKGPEPESKKLKSLSEDRTEDRDRYVSNSGVKQFDRLMEKYKIKIPVLKVKGLKEEQRLIEFSSWKIKKRTVFEYYQLTNVIYRDPYYDVELPEGRDPRRMTDEEFAKYVGEVMGQDLSPTSPQLKTLKERQTLFWMKYESKCDNVYKKQSLAYTIIMEGLDNELTNKYVLGHDDLVNEPKKLWEEIHKDFYPDDKFTIHFMIFFFLKIQL